jgi:hypothetical protein
VINVLIEQYPAYLYGYYNGKILVAMPGTGWEYNVSGDFEASAIE